MLRINGIYITRFRAIVLMLAAASAVWVTADSLDAVFPKNSREPDLGFGAVSDSFHSAPAIRASLDGGKLDALLDLTVKSVDETTSFTAGFGSGKPLRIMERKGSAGTKQLQIRTATLPDTTDGLFHWAPGDPLYIQAWRDSFPIELTLLGWVVQPATGDSDSDRKAFRRRIFFWTHLLLLAFCTLGAVGSVTWPRPRAFEAEGFIRELIQSLEADNPRRTNQVHEFLERVLIMKMAPAAALDKMGLRRPSERYRVAFAATKLLVEAANRLQADLLALSKTCQLDPRNA